MKNKEVAVVTGANKGLGFETCRQLKELGMYVILTARDEIKAKRSAQLIDTSGSEVSWAVLDVTNKASISNFAEEFGKKWKTLDVLINNAAIAINDRLDKDSARLTIDTNFYGPMYVTEALLPFMRKGTRIVMVSSIMGQLSCLSDELRHRFESEALTKEELIGLMEDFVSSVGDGTYAKKGWPSSAYSVSKAGLNMLTRILAKELSGRGIMVNAVHPGWVRTDMGGKFAPLDIKTGARSIVWGATVKPGGPVGGFFHDGKPMHF
ncbi:MAG: SDR family NAD(P)-dependent oxidoreductase [bacterium]